MLEGEVATGKRGSCPRLTGDVTCEDEESHWGKHSHLQALTIAERLAGKQVDMPPIRQVKRTFKQAPKARPATVVEAVEAEAPQVWNDVEHQGLSTPT